MEYTELDTPIPLLGSGVDRSDTVKTGIPHLTPIIKYIQDTLGVGPNRSGSGFANREATMDAGFVWERTLETVYKDNLGDRIGEIEFDGVVGSPDGVGVDPLEPDVMALEEYKFTWVSTRNKPTDVSGYPGWYWMTQCKSYCYMLGLDRVIMRIMYVNGDYKANFGPTPLTCRVIYTESELSKNWQMIKNHEKRMREEGLI